MCGVCRKGGVRISNSSSHGIHVTTNYHQLPHQQPKWDDSDSVKRCAMICHNPLMGETIDCPSKIVPRFLQGKTRQACCMVFLPFSITSAEWTALLSFDTAVTSIAPVFPTLWSEAIR